MIKLTVGQRKPLLHKPGCGSPNTLVGDDFCVGVNFESSITLSGPPLVEAFMRSIFHVALCFSGFFVESFEGFRLLTSA